MWLITAQFAIMVITSILLTPVLAVIKAITTKPITLHMPALSSQPIVKPVTHKMPGLLQPSITIRPGSQSIQASTKIIGIYDPNVTPIHPTMPFSLAPHPVTHRQQ